MKIKALKPKKGRGKIEVLAHMKEISSLLDEGYTRKSIYTALVSEKQISVGYVAFCRHITAALAPTEVSPKEDSSQKTSPKLKTKGCGHNNNMTDEEFDAATGGIK